MTVTIVDIAKKLNLSHTTVSRVLNNKRGLYISDETRHRVLQASAELGYRPNAAARTLVTGRTHRIAMWVPGIEGHFFHEIRVLIHRMLADQHFDLLTSEFNPSLLSDAAPSVFSRIDVDGVLLYGNSSNAHIRQLLDSTFAARIPIVCMGLSSQCERDFVNVDMYAASKHAAEHLLASGCKRPLYIYMPNAVDDRHRGYADAMRDAGRSGEYLQVPDFTKHTGRRAIKEYIAAHGRPDGIFCISDELAIGVARGLKDLDLSIPNDVVLAGCEGIDDLDYFDSPISSVAVPKEDLCRTAWQFLFNRIENPKTPQQTRYLTATLKIRK
jgi:LacI family transcriptional regulator